MGNSDDEYRRTLEEIAAKCGAAERLRFLPPVPVNEIWKYAGAMDVGIMPIENLCLSYYYTLPNKFFENVQSLTPVICSDLPEMHRLVDEYGIGLVCEPENVDDLAQCLERMRTDREFYNSCQAGALLGTGKDRPFGRLSEISLIRKLLPQQYGPCERSMHSAIS